MTAASVDPGDNSTETSDDAFEAEQQSLYSEESMTSEAARDLLETEWTNAIA